MNDSELDRRLGLLTDVHDFRAKAKRLLIKAYTESLGQSFRPVFAYGLRTAEEQLGLFAKGRTFIGPNRLEYKAWTLNGEQRPVTYALPLDSAHCFGAAIDLALVTRADGHWLPDGHWAWGALAKWTEGEDLASGHRWSPRFRDSAHCELPGWKELADDGQLPLIG